MEADCHPLVLKHKPFCFAPPGSHVLVCSSDWIRKALWLSDDSPAGHIHGKFIRNRYFIPLPLAFFVLGILMDLDENSY